MTDLRTALRLDAVASGTTGVLLLALAGVLDGVLGLPVALSLGVAFVLAQAAVVAGFVALQAAGLRRDRTAVA